MCPAIAVAAALLLAGCAASAVRGDDEAVIEQSGEGCAQRFEDFIDTAYENSLLDITNLFPTEECWNTLDDREVVCAVYDPAGPVEGSLKGQGELYALPGAVTAWRTTGPRLICAEEHFADLPDHRC